MSDYTNWSLRKPPSNVKVMIKFMDGTHAIGYRDTFDYIHKEDGSIVGDHLAVPILWKKLEKDEWGNYLW